MSAKCAWDASLRCLSGARAASGPTAPCSGEVLCVELVILFPLAVDEPELPGVWATRTIVAQTLEETADPRGVGAGLDGYLHPLTSREVPLERLGARAPLALFDHFAALGVEHVEVTMLVADVDAGGGGVT